MASVNVIERNADRYIEVANCSTKKACLIGFLSLMVFPGLAYIAYDDSRCERERERLKNKIINIPILNDVDKESYCKSIKKLKDNFLDVSSFPLPEIKEKRDITSVFCNAFLEYDSAKTTIPLIESGNCLPKVMNALKKSRAIDMPDLYFNVIGDIKKVESNPQIREMNGGVDYTACCVFDLLNKFVIHNRSAEVNQCFDLMEEFLNIPSQKSFSVNSEFLNGFVQAFCLHKDEMIRDVQAAEQSSKPAVIRDLWKKIFASKQPEIKEALWKKIEDQYLPPLEAVAQRLENDEAVTEALSNVPPKTLPLKPEYGQWTVKPIGTSTGWLGQIVRRWFEEIARS